MRISSCVPLPGRGIVARHGALIAVTDGSGPGTDPLLGALAEVAAAGGDGSDLVRMAARAALGCPGQPAWACAGVTAAGGVAVLVHGLAAAEVSVAGTAGVTLTASDSVIPVSRTFSGETVSLTLTSGQPAAADPRCWLGSGVVAGAGLAVTVSAGAGEPAGPPLITGFDATFPGGNGEPGEPRATAGSALASGQQTWAGGPQAAGPSDWHPPTVDTATGLPQAGTGPAPAPEEPAADVPPPVLVDGALCLREHFNDPSVWTCRECGAAMDQPPRNLQRRPRPPLGVMLFDDGARITLDGDYVLGREPGLDGEVMAGRARPVRISDPEGTVSRLHLRISLTGWQVEVSDLGSANGSSLQSSGGERALAPFEPAVADPGARIGIGHRSMQYLAYQGVHP
jgi:FHA domain